jgi:hypothetical protein
MGAFPGSDPFQGLTGWLSSVLGFLRNAANAVVGVFKRLWDYLYNHFLKAILNALIHHKGRLWTVLQTIHQWIVRIRDYEKGLFDTYVRPLINFIQRLRAALLIFRIFHFKWAAALDNRLASMESQLTRLWLNVLGEFNRLLSYYDLIMNPTGLFRSGVYLMTALKSIGQLFGALHQAQNVPVGAADLASMEADSHLLDRQATINNATLTAATGIQPEYKTRQDAIWSALTDMGYTERA